MDHQHVNRQIVNRLSRLEGHVRSIKEMVASGRDCAEVLVQMAAVRSALDRAGYAILEDHLEHCVGEALDGGKGQRAVEDLKKALKRFIG